MLRNCGDATNDFRGELVKKASTGDCTVRGEGKALSDGSNLWHSDKLTATEISEKTIMLSIVDWRKETMNTS